jgi:uncharacterized damage-inducible protein DinB
MNDMLVHFFRHNLWANLRLLEACEGLSSSQLDTSAVGTYGDLGHTLVHIAASEESYLARLAGAPAPDRAWAQGAFPGLPTLREHLRCSGEELVSVVESDQGPRLLRGTWRGEEYALFSQVILLQAINHATEHRAQASAILTLLGLQPPDMDAWTFEEAVPLMPNA